jgi:hypothetical protein
MSGVRIRERGELMPHERVNPYPQPQYGKLFFGFVVMAAIGGLIFYLSTRSAGDQVIETDVQQQPVVTDTVSVVMDQQTAASPVPTLTPFEVTREVPVEIPVEIPVEVTREVPVEIPVEVTREVPVERVMQVTVMVPVEVTRHVYLTQIVEVTREVPVTLTPTNTLVDLPTSTPTSTSTITATPTSSPVPPTSSPVPPTSSPVPPTSSPTQEVSP